jgi:hypothetical protein
VDDAVLTVGSSSVIFAHQAARLGLRVAFAGKVGPDVFGEFMMERLARVGVETSTIVVDPGVKTGVTVHLVRRTDRAMLAHPGSIAALRPDDVAEALLASTRHVHLGSYFLCWPLAGVARSARHGGALIGDHAVPRHRISRWGVPSFYRQPLGRDHGHRQGGGGFRRTGSRPDAARRLLAKEQAAPARRRGDRRSRRK